MPYLFHVIALALAVLLALPVQAQDATSQALSALAKSYAERRNFSGTILVAREGKVLLAESYGKADMEWDIPNVPQARYRVGSLSKPLTATLTMSLVESGILSLDGTLGQYLPEIYADTAISAVTVRQLLSHTSGIKDLPRDSEGPWWQSTGRLSFAPKDLAKAWITPELVEEPGSKWRYNNAGYVLLGIIIEEATGLSYARNMQERIFGPAGMTNSGVYGEKDVIPMLARAYARAPDGSFTQPIRFDSSIMFSAAGIYSTAEDLLRFNQALDANILVGEQTRIAMMSKQSDFAYGFGWGIEKVALPDGKALQTIGHSGSIPGYQSYFLRSESTRDFVVVLNNTNNGVVIAMGRDLMQVLNGKPMQPAKRRLTETLLPVLETDGLDAMIAAYDAIAPNKADFDLREARLNRDGYNLMAKGRTDAAIAFFEWNTQLYPQSANTHDSLGEAYRKAGRTDDAVKSYSTALKLDPTSTSARTAIDEIRASE